MIQTKNKKLSRSPNIFSGFWLVRKYLMPHRRHLVVLTAISVCAALLSAVVPYLGGRVIDAIITPTTVSIPYVGQAFLVYVFIAVWFVIRLVNDALEWQLGQRSSLLGARLEAEYIVAAFSKLLTLPLSFHRSRKIGEVHNRVSRAASWLDQLVNVLIHLAPQMISIVFALALAFWIRVSLALVLIIGVALYILVLLPVAPAIARAAHRSHRAYSNAYGDAYDAVANVSAIKQATAETYERRKLYRSFVIRAYGKWSRMRKLWGVLSITQRILITLVQLAIYIVGFAFVAQKELTVGELIMFNGYAAMFFGPFVQLGYNWETIQNGIITLQRAERVLENSPESYVPKNTIVLDHLRGEVAFEHVWFAYGKRQKEALRDISFAVRPGERIALVGESGVGKSTLVDLISHYFKLTKGRVAIDGHSIEQLDLTFLRSQISVVPQEIVLFNDTVLNNIRYGHFGASEEEVMAAARKAHASEFIERFPKKYEQVVGERGIKLSVGQKQRIAIARAILRSPTILILDEPTSALDAKSERAIETSLQELMRGRTTFIIAHRLSTVRTVDRIFVLSGGTIVEVGSHDELLQKENGVYRRLYELQIGFS